MSHLTITKCSQRTAGLLLAASLFMSPLLVAPVNGHALVLAVQGDNGVEGTGFGVVASTPRDGSRRNPFQTDSSVFKNLQAQPCGQTIAGGPNNIPQSLAKAEAAGGGELPSLDSSNTITMTIHQVNADGGGPFTASFNADGTGNQWAPAQVVEQAKGAGGITIGAPKDSQLQVQLPANAACTGGANGNACLVRVMNGGIARAAGPFGGCMAVQQAGAAGNATAQRRSVRDANTITRLASRGARVNNLVSRDALIQNLMTRANSVKPMSEALGKRMAARGAPLSRADAAEMGKAVNTAAEAMIEAMTVNDGRQLAGNCVAADGSVLLSVEQADALKKAMRDATALLDDIARAGGQGAAAAAAANGTAVLNEGANANATATAAANSTAIASDAAAAASGTAQATASALPAPSVTVGKGANRGAEGNGAARGNGNNGAARGNGENGANRGKGADNPGNGPKAGKGAKGENAANGAKGENAANGAKGENAANGAQGADGENAANGAKGAKAAKNEVGAEDGAAAEADVAGAATGDPADPATAAILAQIAREDAAKVRRHERVRLVSSRH